VETIYKIIATAIPPIPYRIKARDNGSVSVIIKRVKTTVTPPIIVERLAYIKPRIIIFEGCIDRFFLNDLRGEL